MEIDNLDQRQLAHTNQVVLAIDDWHKLPVCCPAPDETVPSLLTEHGLCSSGDLLHSSLDPLGVAAEVGGLHLLLLDLLQLLPGEVAGGDGLLGLVPADELLQTGGPQC